MYAVYTLPSVPAACEAGLIHTLSVYGCQATQYSIYIIQIILLNTYSALSKYMCVLYLLAATLLKCLAAMHII